MKICQNCGYGYDDEGKFCPYCGSSEVKTDINIQIDETKQEQPSSKDNIQIIHNTYNKILYSLWVLVSLMPLINGYGIIYAGHKTSNNKLVLEGIIYELPWLFYFLFNSLGVSALSGLMTGLGVIGFFVSMVRSVMIISNYHNLLKNYSYKKSKNKLVSLIYFILSFCLFINGLVFIHLGNKGSKKTLIEGIVYEIIWALTLIIHNNFMVGVALISVFVSSMRMIRLNYTDEHLYTIQNNQTYAQINNNMDNDKINTENTIEFGNNLYSEYIVQFNQLRDSYDKKEEKVKDLIEERFNKSSLTYRKFIAVIDDSHENFYKEMESGMDLINYTSERTQKVEEELDERIEYLKLINEKIEKLTVELVLNIYEDDKSDKKVENVLTDMEDLINSMDDYQIKK